MLELIFDEPQKFSEIHKYLEPNLAGIYIWGFKGLLEGAPEKVIPYYVGIKVDSILKRIISHRIDILSLNSTYKRLSEGYMHQYFYDSPSDYPPFPLITKNDRKKTKLNWPGWKFPDDYDKAFDYINNFDFLKNIKKIESPDLLNNLDNFPIYFLNQNTKRDALADRIREGNFWIYFAKVDKNNKEYNKLYQNKGASHKYAFEYIEAFVKYSLKGITVSKSKPFNCWKEYNFTINKDKLKGNNQIFKPEPSLIFKGDY